MTQTLRAICEENQLLLVDSNRLTGGDINDVFLIRTDGGPYVIKLNSAKAFPNMFETEAKGLTLLQSSQSFRIPQVKTIGRQNDLSYLIMEYLPQGEITDSFWTNFAQNLVQLHSFTGTEFGLDHDNYIGSLPQFNQPSEDAYSFYIQSRLEPQFKWAQNHGFSFSLDSFYKNLKSEIPNEAPALIHGDLWNGNYMVGDNEIPILIDPAVAYAPREMDLAMMQLFGGFPQEVYNNYNNQFPLEKGWQDRTSIWQLYYLLVHLNLFGSGYYSQVKRIVDRYS